VEFGSRNVILFPDANGRIIYPAEPGLPESLNGADLSVAQWVFDHNEMAGQGTTTLPGAKAVYFPIDGGNTMLGVLAMLPVNLRRVFLPEQQKLLDTFLRLIAQAIARLRLAEQAKSVQLQIETEGLRNSLLSSISHDLRTPLATIVGSASTLAEDDGSVKAEEKCEVSRALVDRHGADPFRQAIGRARNQGYAASRHPVDLLRRRHDRAGLVEFVGKRLALYAGRQPA
jgi:two-component system sensor histidine kinase KdpD